MADSVAAETAVQAAFKAKQDAAQAALSRQSECYKDMQKWSDRIFELEKDGPSSELPQARAEKERATAALEEARRVVKEMGA